MSDKLIKVALSDGTFAYTMTEEQATALEQILDDRIWWQDTVVRLRRVSYIVAAGGSVLMAISLWWPWVSRVAQFILKGVPSS